MWLIIFFWSMNYLNMLTKNGLTILRLRKALNKLVDFVAVYGNSDSYFRPEKEVYAEELRSLLVYYPEIKKLVTYPQLNYHQNDEEIYRNSVFLIRELQMMQNSAKCEFINSLNPLHAAKDLVLFPISVIRNLGFQPSRFIALICEAGFWLIGYLMDTFQPEIKLLILHALENIP